MKIKGINGFKDILPDEVEYYRLLEESGRDILNRFTFREIRLPVLEKTELFARSIGESTDIVEKEMYTFVEQGMTMRPEATASLMRAFIEHALHLQRPVQRLFTIGPMFRHERPQKGRLRQFHQLNAEIVGGVEPALDVELISLADMLLTELGVETTLELNSLGCPACRPVFRQQLIDFLATHHEQLCQDCQRRIKHNPLRVLDCKQSACRKTVEAAPSIIEALCIDCSDHFQGVQQGLTLLGVPFELNPFMVRGLDYYTRTTFEFTTDQLGAQAAVGAGGRYDGLIKQLGGPPLPGIGFALGLERLVLLLQQQPEEEKPTAAVPDLYLVTLGDEPLRLAQLLSHRLRAAGISVIMDYSGRSLKAQMKQAGRYQAQHTLIIGESELAAGALQLRNMVSKEQVELPLAQGEPEAFIATLMAHLAV